MKKREREIFENRADLGSFAENDCDHCGLSLVFALRGGEVEFSLNLATVLRCLRIAEDEACVPELPDGWWDQMESRYGPWEP